MDVGIIGAGTVGSTIAIRLGQSGYNIKYIASRTLERAQELARRTGAQVVEIHRAIAGSEIVFITTPDYAIEPLVQQFASNFQKDQLVVHCSGALSSQILHPVKAKGARTLSIHPLQSFASLELALLGIQGTHFSVEGDDPQTGVEIVESIGGIAHICVPEGKVMYHAGACFVSNYLAVLAEIGVNLLEMAGFKREDALSSLLPLMQGSMDNIKSLGLPQALTGPISRGDVGVIIKHLTGIPYEYQAIYRLLGSRAANLGEEKGTLDPKIREQICKLLAQPVEAKEEYYEKDNYSRLIT